MAIDIEKEGFRIINGDSLVVLETLEANSIDAIVTDPPYELGFMGKSWDRTGIAYNVELWKKALRVLKPGGYLLAFGGTRTYHRIACAIEDAGFEIRDCIMWLYGCLSEDTEVLTKSGFKQFHKITSDDIIRIYDIENNIYKWEKPARWNFYKVNKDTCYRIKSNTTDQLVSRNHRCLVEQNGKLVFKFAEELCDMERVPVLSYDIHFLQESKRNILFSNLLWQDERLAEKLFSEWQGKEKFQKGFENGKESCLEGWNNLSQKKRKLCQSKHQVCKVSKRIYDNGEKRWLCNGTSLESSDGNETTTFENRVCPSYKSQCGGQQIGKSNVVCLEQRPQGLRKWKTYKTTLAKITKEEYTGIIFCPTVSTGCFVARRNGKVFITGNSGFPKSMNIGLAIDKKNGIESEVVGTGKSGSTAKAFNLSEQQREAGTGVLAGEYEIKKANNEWNGYGTALKPAYEPIIMARKPVEGTVIDNVMKYGVGGINIDECRIGLNNGETKHGGFGQAKTGFQKGIGNSGDNDYKCEWVENTEGRFPANVIHDGSDEVVKDMPETNGSQGKPFGAADYSEKNTATVFTRGDYVPYNDNGNASRFFYCAKASSKDRDEGLIAFESRKCSMMASNDNIDENGNVTGMLAGRETMRKNFHPTVKPVDLMQYLVRLVAPRGSVVLDIFNGSGSTGKAVAFENRERNAGYRYIGIELDPEYCRISESRIDYALHKYVYDVIEEVKENEKKGQLSLFDFGGDDSDE